MVFLFVLVFRKDGKKSEDDNDKPINPNYLLNKEKQNPNENNKYEIPKVLSKIESEKTKVELKQRKERKLFLRRTFSYLFFLSLLVIASTSNIDQSSFSYQEQIKKRFAPFNDEVKILL